MKKFFALLTLASFVFACTAAKSSHDLVKQLGQKKDAITKAFGEPKTSEPYGATTRFSYEGEFAGIPGTWSYYALESDGSVVSAEFTAKGEHQPIFLETLVKTLGQPLSVDQMTADVPADDVMGAMVIGQIKQRYDDGMRVWRNDKNGTTYILDVAPEKDGEALVTTIVSLDEKKLNSMENASADTTGAANAGQAGTDAAATTDAAASSSTDSAAANANNAAPAAN